MGSEPPINSVHVQEIRANLCDDLRHPRKIAGASGWIGKLGEFGWIFGHHGISRISGPIESEN